MRLDRAGDHWIMGTIGGLGLVVLLVAALAVAVRLPDAASLSVDGHVPDAQAPSSGPSTSGVPAPTATDRATATAAPAPLAVPSPDSTAPDAPDTGADDLPAVTEGGLVAPDGSDGPAPATAAAAPAPAAPPPTTPVGPGSGDTPRSRFESRFPAHAAATQDVADPVTTRWAILVGVNEHSGTTRDNIGSRQDAESLYAHLMDLGWAPDHVLLLTDGLATRETMIEAVHWLARKTTRDSMAVFSYSGHAKQWPGQDVDGDGETTDEALWPTDNQHITDREFADLMGTVTAGQVWLNFMACEGAGFLDEGLVRDGRVVTFSSAEDEKSYEDPSVGHSVWGWNLTVQGLRHGQADANGDGEVTVQEAASYAIPRAARRTQNQTPHGPQNGGMVDRAGGPLALTIPPPPPPPEPRPSSEPSPSPEPSPSNDGCLLGLCSGRD